jgi:hypothetical protein
MFSHNHTYVVSVCSRCFICFRRMLYSSVSCCMCFMLFGGSGGAAERVDGPQLWSGDAGARRREAHVGMHNEPARET